MGRFSKVVFLVLIAGLAMTGFARARGRNTLTPREVVEKYCELDANGANFSAGEPGAAAISDLLYDPDEAAYDTSAIVTDVQVESPTLFHSRAEVKVVYIVLGTIGGDGTADSASRKETVTFHLAHINGAWKIDHLRQMTHISKAWILQHLKEPSAGNPSLVAAAKIERW